MLVIDGLTKMDIVQARNPRRRLRDLVGHDAQVHWPDDLCLHWVGRCISSLLNPICHVNYVTLLLTAYYIDHFRVVSILCTSLEYPTSSSGNVSQGAQEVFQELPHEYVAPSMLHKVMIVLHLVD